MEIVAPPTRWWLIPLSAIALCAIPNGILIALAVARPLAKTDDLPYAASARIDGDKAALAALQAAGGGITLTPTHGTLTLTWAGPVAGVRTVELQRPADPSRDRHQTWATGDTVQLTGLDPGPWRVRVRQDAALLVDQRCDLP